MTDKFPFTPAPVVTVDQAVAAAFETPDPKAVIAQVEAARRALSAARCERLPSLDVSGDYQVIGPNPASSHGAFNVTVR